MRAEQIFVLGILAGVYIGFGALTMLCCGGNCPGIASTDPGLKAMLSGLIGLPCGLLMVLISGAELFTGNTALVTAALLEGRVSFGQLAKSWIFSWMGNLVGSVALAAAAVAAGVLATNPSVTAVASAKTSLAWGAVSIFLHHVIKMHFFPCTVSDALSSWLGNSVALAAAAVAAGILVTHPSVTVGASAKTSLAWEAVSVFPSSGP
jgi:formate/nitrite transporter FocA (FNT family)